MKFRSLHGVGCSRVRRTGAVAVVIGCLVATVPAMAGGGHWTMTAVDGAAMVIAGGAKEHVAEQGHPVGTGATLVTGPDGTVVLMRRGDSITVYPNSEVSIPDAASGDHLGVVQGFGKLLYRMETRESWNFEVRTPYLAATVKGTVFTVKVTHDEATVSVSEGMVRVAPARGGRGTMVRAGNRGTVGAASMHEVSVENVDPEKTNFWSIGRIRGKPVRGDREDARSRNDPSQRDSQDGDAQGGDSQGGDPSRGGAQGGNAQGNQP